MAALREALRILARASAPRQGEMNALRMFAGPMAKTADHQALARAQEMAGQGATRDTIWRDTGWFQGVDGKWRFEIDDSGAVYRGLPDVASEKFDLQRALQRRYGGTMSDIRERYPNDPDVVRYAALYDRNMDRITGNINQTPRDRLSDAFDHPQLGAAYPGVMDTPFGEGGVASTSRGHFNRGTGSLHVDGSMPTPERRSVALHEVQHRLQEGEGFARGGNPDEVLRGDLEEINRRLSEIARQMDEQRFRPRAEAADAQEQIKALNAEYDALLARRAAEHSPEAELAAYRRLAGETEARNVQTRRDFTPEERRARPPWETQDVPDDQQIVRFDGDRASNALGDILRASAGLGGVALAGDITLRELLRERRANRANPSA